MGRSEHLATVASSPAALRVLRKGVAEHPHGLDEAGAAGVPPMVEVRMGVGESPIFEKGEAGHVPSRIISSFFAVLCRILSLLRLSSCLFKSSACAACQCECSNLQKRLGPASSSGGASQHVQASLW